MRIGFGSAILPEATLISFEKDPETAPPNAISSFQAGGQFLPLQGSDEDTQSIDKDL